MCLIIAYGVDAAAVSLLAIWLLLLDRHFGAMMSPSHVMDALLCVVLFVLLGVYFSLGRHMWLGDCLLGCCRLWSGGGSSLVVSSLDIVGSSLWCYNGYSLLFARCCLWCCDNCSLVADILFSHPRGLEATSF